MARWSSNNQYVNIDLNVSNIYLTGDWPYIYFHFDCNFNYYCPSGWASMSYNNVEFNTQVSGYATETKTDNVSFSISAGQESSRYGGNYYNPDLGNSRQRTVDVHAWISNGLYTGGGWTTVASPTIGDPSSLQLSISNVTQNSCVVSHSFTNNRNFWFVRLWDRNTKTYYTLNNNAGNGTTTITGLNPNQTYAFELWACGRDGNEYQGAHPAYTITTLGKSSIGNTPTYTIENSFVLNISGYSDSFTHTATFTVGGYSFSRTNLKRGNVTIIPSAAENNAIYAQMTTVLSKDMNISLTTFVNGNSIGSNGGSGTVNINTAVCTPTVNSFSYKDVNPTSIALTGNEQYVIQNVSKLQISDINASPRNTASIAKYRLEISNSTYENTSTTILTNTITANTQMSVKAIDSRGLQGALNKNYTMFVPYTNPSVTTFSVTRANGIEMKTTLELAGKYSPVTINGINKNTIVTVKYRYKPTTSTTWGSLNTITFVADTSSFSYKNVIGDFTVDASYNFELQVTDKVTTTTTSTILVVGKPSLSVRKNSVGINKVPTSGIALDVDGMVNSTAGYSNIQNGVSTKISSENSGYTHYITNSSSGHYFNKDIRIQGNIYGGPNYNLMVPFTSQVLNYRYRLHASDGTSINNIAHEYGFDYNTGGAGLSGSYLSFSGLGDVYPVQIIADYSSGATFKFRSKNGDNGKWNPWYRLVREDETPIITTGSGWNVFRFPSGFMIQTGVFNANPTFNEKSGSINFGRFPAVANFPISFTAMPIVSITAQKGYSEVFVSPAAYTTNVNACGGLQSYVGTGVAYGQGYSVNMHIIAIGRWK